MSALIQRAKSTRGLKTTHGRKRLRNLDKAGTRPSDELTARYVQFGDVVRGLHSYYETVKTTELDAAKAATQQADHLPVPFKEGAQFDQEKGFQHVLYSVRDHTRTISSTHTDLANKIDSAVILPLNTLLKEIGDHTAAIDADLGKTTNLLAEARKESIKAIGEHSKGVGLSASQVGHSATTSKNDPFITHGIVQRRLTQQIELENKCTTSTIHWQKTSEAFEARLVTTIHDVNKSFTTSQLAAEDKVKAEWEAIQTLITGVSTTAEWEYYANPETGRIVDPNTTLRDKSLIAFPNQNDESVTPIKTGFLERKKRYTKSYTEFYFVLTPSGFLHAYPHEGVEGSLEPEAMLPRLSLYLPDFALGPASTEKDKKHKFHVTASRNSAVGKDSSKGFLGLNKKKEIAYTFKARSHGELLAWWEAIDKVAKTSVTVTSNADRTKGASKAEAAVANVGLPVEEHEDEEGFVDAESAPVEPTPVTSPKVGQSEDDDEASVGGSSVEEEAAAAADVTLSNQAESSEVAPASESLPGYATTEGSSAYPIEKKVAFEEPKPVGEPSASAIAKVGM